MCISLDRRKKMASMNHQLNLQKLLLQTVLTAMKKYMLFSPSTKLYTLNSD